MNTQVLLAITFVFGVVFLLTRTKVFSANLSYIFNILIPHNEDSFFGKILSILNMWFFYFSLCFQAWYWLFSGRI